MINATAEHDQPNSLAALQPLVQAEIGDDSPCNIPRYLHEGVIVPLFIFNSNQRVLVVLTGGIAESSTELAFDVL